MANETVIHTSLFVRGAQDPNIPAQRFAVFTGTGATDTNLLGYRTASGIVSDLGLPEIIDDEVANLLSGGTNISLTYDDVANKLVISSTGSLAGSGTANQVAFWNATGVTGENDLWWNPSSNFLGIGTNSPSNSIHIESAGSTTSYLKTTSSSLFSAVQLANSSNNITSLQNYSPSATGTTAGLNNANLSVLNSTSSLALNTGTGSAIVSGIGGIQMMRVTSNGVIVGTGTTAARTLQVDGDFRLGSISGIMTNQILGRNSNNGDVGAMILGEGLALSMYTLSVTGTTFGTGTTNQIAYWATSSSITGENDLWWNPTNNFLGIGTNSPSNSLQINAISPSISLISSTASGTSSIGLRNDLNNFSQIITYGSSNASTLYSLNLSNSTNIVTSNNIFLTPTGGSLLVGNGVSEYFRATSTGVGIGGVIPARTLHVAGTMRLTGSTATTPTNILARNNDGDISNLVIGTGLNLSSGALSVSGATGTGVTNQVAFWANTTTLSGETALWWNPSTDCLGIGTNAPAQTLDVAGTMRLTGSTGTSATIMGRNPSGDISAIVVDGGLSLSGNVLSATGVTYGTGTTNYLSKWASATGLTDSIVLETGSTIDINGSLRVRTSSGTATSVMGRDANGYVSNITTGAGLQISNGTLSLTGATGTGTTGIVPRWASSSGLTDSIIFSTGTVVGINTTNPQATLDVRGTMRLTGSTGSPVTTIMGRNANGDISNATIGTGLQLTNGTLSLTGATGTGTTNYLSKWASATGLTDSIVLETGNTIDIAGSLRVRTSSGTATSVMGRDANGYVSNITTGAGLQISNGTLSLTGATGTGTTGIVPRWASSSGLTDSVIFSTGTVVGINTTNPQATLDVRGTMRLTGSTGSPVTTIMGRNANGDISNAAIGTGLQLTNGTLSLTGATGTGTTNYLSKWASATGLTDSIVLETGNTVDIAGSLRVRTSSGTATVVMGRDVNGYVSNITTGAGLQISNGTLSLTGATGTGTTGYVPRWVSSSGLTDSVIFSTGTVVGINTTNPQATLHVAGTMRLTGSTGNPPSAILGRDSNGDINNVTIGSGLSLNNGQLSATGGASGTTTGNGAANQVAFWTGTNAISGENNLWWDSSADKLGIGTDNPQATLDVRGTMRLTGSTTNPAITLMGRSIDSDVSAISVGSGLSLSGNILTITGVATGTVTGTGTTNYLSKWASATGLTDSIVLETGNTVDIAGSLRVRTSSGTATNVMGRDVNGYVSNITTGAGLQISNGTLSLTGATGTGTTGYVPRWASSSGLTDSVIFSTGTVVGINTTNPQATLHVAGTMRLTGSTGSPITTIMGRNANGDISNATIGTGLQLNNGTLSLTGATGTGTTNYLSKWASATGLTDSIVLETGNTIDIAGSLRVRTSSGTATSVMGRDANGYVSNITTGAGLQISNGTLSLTGATGTGTTGIVPRWASSSGLTDSVIFSTGTVVGINTTNPQATLDVRGTMRLTGSTGSPVTTIMGRNANGDISNAAIGTGLQLNNGTLSLTGATGTGTTNYLSKWASATGLTDSIVLETGNTIDIAGSLRVRTSSGTATSVMGRDANGYVSNITTGAGLQISNGTLSLTGATGTGTTGYVPRWASSSGLTDSVIFSTGTVVGINTTNPQATLDVRGTMRLTGSTGSPVTTIMGRNANGDISNATIGTGLQLTNGTLSLTGATGTGTTNYLSKWASATGLTDSIVLETGNTIDIAGSLRVRTSSGTATSVMGRDANGYVSNITTGAGLQISNGTLSLTGATGTGTTGIVPRWASSSGLTDSVIFSTGTVVGINTTNPQATLDVRGTMRLTGSTGNPPSAILGRDSNGDINNVTIGSGLSLNNGQLSATGGASGTTTGNGAANQVAFWTGTNAISGENNLWWDSSADKLGIGTDNPQATLDVRGTMRLTGSTGSPVTTIMGRDGSGDIGNVGVGVGLQLTNGTLSLTGATGTGTTNYLSKWASATGLTDSIVLETGNTVDIAGSLRVRTSSGTATVVMGRDVNGYVSNITTGAGLQISNGTLSLTGATGTGTTGYVPRWVSSSGLTDSVIFSTGTVVGINTTNPQATLHVAGTMRLTGSTGNPPSAILGRDSNGDISNLTIGSGLSLNNGQLSATGGASGTTTGNGAANQVAFWTGTNAISGENNLWWDSSADKLGIGTDNPQATLHVAGTMRLTGSTGSPITTIMGRNANGDISNATIGTGLQLSNGTLSLTGATGTGTTGYLAYFSDNNTLTSNNQNRTLFWDVTGNTLELSEEDNLNSPKLLISTKKYNNDNSTLEKATFEIKNNIDSGIESSVKFILNEDETRGYLKFINDYVEDKFYITTVFDTELNGDNKLEKLFINNITPVLSTSQANVLLGRFPQLSGNNFEDSFGVTGISIGNGLRLNSNVLSLTGATGTGTTGYVPRWVSSSGLTDSVIFSTGTVVGINTTNPQATLHVAGTMRLTGSTGNPPSAILGRDSNGDISNTTIGSGLQLNNGTLSLTGATGTGTTGRIAIWSGTTSLGDSVMFSASGNVGISSTSPLAKLYVKGNTSNNSSTTLEIVDSSDRDLLNIRSDGKITLGKNASISTQNCVTIEPSGTDANISLVFATKGTGAFIGSIPDETAIGGDARGAYAVDMQRTRDSRTQVASGSYAVINGGANNVADAIAATVNGGFNNQANGSYSSINGGYVNMAMGTYASINGGYCNATSAFASSIVGGFYTKAYLYGQNAVASGHFNSVFGDAQTSNVRVRIQLTGTTTQELFLDGVSEKVTLSNANNTLWNAKIQLSAVVISGGTGTTVTGDSWVSEHLVGIKKVNGVTTLVGTGIVQNLISNDTSMSTANVTILANNTDGALRIRFTPPTTAGNNTIIRVLATVYLTEIGF